MRNKFNKVMMSLIAFKLQKESRSSEEENRAESATLHELIEQVLDDSPVRSFKEYY